MGKKKKKGYGYTVLNIMLVLMLAFIGIASAEQQFYPGFIDKEGEIGTNEKSWRIGWINTLVMEGVSNSSEFYLRPTTLTADRFVNAPDASGTMALSEHIGTAMRLTDAKVLVGASTGLAAEQTLSLTNDVTGTLVNSGGIVATIPASTINTSMILDGTILNTDISTGGVNTTNILDATIAAADIGANAVGTSEANFNTVSLLVNAGAGINTVTVEAGSTLVNWRLSAVAVVQNTPAIFNSDATTWVINTNEWLAADATFTLLFLKP